MKMTNKRHIAFTGAVCALTMAGALGAASCVINKEMVPVNAATYDGKLQKGYKTRGEHNPITTVRFGADPWALVYGDAVYVYSTGDTLEKDASGAVTENTYGKIHTINVHSSRDLVNWTDHGRVDVKLRDTSAWSNNSWAPAAAWREIDGKPQFFLYFANSANGIGVLRSDSPTGPFVDPIGRPIVSRDTPNCREVTWLFDPAVLIDDDGSAYLYFGGGIPGKEYAHPRTARAVKLGADMVSVVGDPVTIDAPYLFEDSGIHKIGSAYYYSYCTNWQVPPEATSQYGFSSGQIAYMTSDNPLGPFTYRGMFLKNPGATFGDWGNNHHCVFSFRDEWFVAYHARLLESRMGILKGYRSVNVDRLSVGADGALLPVTPTRAGISQLAAIDAYSRVNATTASAQAGVDVVGSNPKSRYFGSGAMSVAGMSGGSWVFVEGVDFGETGPASFVANLRRVSGAPGSILVRLDGEGGDLLATVDSLSVADDDGYHEVVAKVTKKITGKHDVFFEFTGGGFEWDSWAFNR